MTDICRSIHEIRRLPNMTNSIPTQCPGCGITATMDVGGWMWHRATRHEGRIVATPDGIHTQDGARMNTGIRKGSK